MTRVCELESKVELDEEDGGDEEDEGGDDVAIGMVIYLNSCSIECILLYGCS